MGKSETFIDVAGRTVRISSPSKVWFPEVEGPTGRLPPLTKLDVVNYWVSLGDRAVRGVHGRPMALERFPKGLGEPPFYQKRVPKSRPDWIEIATLRYPSGRTADEVVVTDLAQLLWVVNLGCFSLHPHGVRIPDLHHPDELRIDLDPVPGVPWSQVLDVAGVVREVLEAHHLVGFPKTSGKRGVHIWVRIVPTRPFEDVRRAALAVAREVERMMPGLATSAWWKEEREGVFVDYNQNAKDRTTAAAFSVRPTPNAQVSMPLSWADVPTAEPAAYTVHNAAALLTDTDPHAALDASPGDLTSLLALADDQDEALGPPPKRSGRGGRVPTRPLLIVGESEDEDEALAGLERWKARYPNVAAQLAPHHVLVDKMRGRYRVWTRIRINLEAVPETERPPQEALDPDAAPRWGAPA